MKIKCYKKSLLIVIFVKMYENQMLQKKFVDCNFRENV
jgi:hypothetical protein